MISKRIHSSKDGQTTEKIPNFTGSPDCRLMESKVRIGLQSLRTAGADAGFCEGGFEFYPHPPR